MLFRSVLAEVGGQVGDAARFIMVGAVTGTHQVGKLGMETIGASAAALVKGAFELGGSVSDTARGAVEGAIESARDADISAEEAATAAANGAVHAAGEISATAMTQVRNAVTQTISGARVVLREPFRPRLEASYPA